jgi:hypothetical protein
VSVIGRIVPAGIVGVTAYGRRVKRPFLACLIIAGLMAWAGNSMVPVAAASSNSAAAVADRGADRVADAARAAAPSFRPASVLDARRRPLPQPVPVVAVPFVCAVHLAEGADAAAAAK